MRHLMLGLKCAILGLGLAVGSSPDAMDLEKAHYVEPRK